MEIIVHCLSWRHNTKVRHGCSVRWKVDQDGWKLLDEAVYISLFDTCPLEQFQNTPMQRILLQPAVSANPLRGGQDLYHCSDKHGYDPTWGWSPCWSNFLGVSCRLQYCLQVPHRCSFHWFPISPSFFFSQFSIWLSRGCCSYCILPSCCRWQRPVLRPKERTRVSILIVSFTGVKSRNCACVGRIQQPASKIQCGLFSVVKCKELDKPVSIDCCICKN